MNADLKIQGTWVFRGILLCTNLAIAVGIFWVRAEIKKELAGYVTKEEFHNYQVAHEKWGDEVVKGLRTSVERIETKVDRLIERRP